MPNPHAALGANADEVRKEYEEGLDEEGGKAHKHNLAEKEDLMVYSVVHGYRIPMMSLSQVD